jgi:hypothetical protein
MDLNFVAKLEIEDQHNVMKERATFPEILTLSGLGAMIGCVLVIFATLMVIAVETDKSVMFVLGTANIVSTVLIAWIIVWLIGLFIGGIVSLFLDRGYQNASVSGLLAGLFIFSPFTTKIPDQWFTLLFPIVGVVSGCSAHWIANKLELFQSEWE